MKKTMISIGNFFFRYRNRLFPVIVIALFAIAPPSQTFLGREDYLPIKDAVAVLIALSGLAFRSLVIGYAYIKRGGMNKKVYADNLVTEGLFAICRNPLYVGNVLMYIGVFLLHGAPMVALSGIVLFLFIYQCIILAEEAYLHAKFGEGYEAYCRDVSRWVPAFSKFREATDGMTFNARLAIKKDYSTMATTFVTLLLTQLYKYLSVAPHAVSDRPALMLIGAILMVGIIAKVIRYYKKRLPPVPVAL